MSFTAILISTPDVLHVFDSQSSKDANHVHHHGEKNVDATEKSHIHGNSGKQSTDTPLAGDGARSIDKAMSVLSNNSTFADWTLWSIRLQDGPGPFSAELRQGTSSVEVDVDPATGAIVNVGDPTKYGVSMDAHNFVQALHFGRVGGATTQFLSVLLGLSPTLLAISGYLMWWNRVLSKKLSPSTR